MQSTARPRFLVKTVSSRGLPAAGLELDRRGLAAAPLFGASRRERWHLVETTEPLEHEENPWDAAHRALGSRLGLGAADAPRWVEPDLLQDWTHENRTRLSSLAFAADVCQFNDQRHDYGLGAVGPGFGWFLDDDHSQLRSARELVGQGRRRVRIAHLDTGFDPGHVTRPAHLDLVNQRNFVETDTPGDASDPARRGFLRNPGHGTGTLSILAGNVLDGVAEAGALAGLPLGGAPQAEIVPMRVANSVVQFRTSAVAQALGAAVELGVDVVSMSLGGLASAAWTDAVNMAYEAGVVLVCAAGNNFGGLPTHFLVFPARFRRVIAACGAMADRRPWADLPGLLMQGNWGPKRAMKEALAAYSPNIPWAEIGCPKVVDMDGNGTSAATPQIAAAAALWLMHHDPQYPEAWMKVEAVRDALFGSARPPAREELMGRGVLAARAALDVAPAAAGTLRKTPRDSARFSLLRLLTGMGSAPSVRASMLELEAIQICQRSKVLERLLEQHDVDPDTPSRHLPLRLQQELAEALAEDPACSNTLRERLGQNVSRGLRPMTAVEIELAQTPRIPSPTTRTLRVFSFDPSLGLEVETAALNRTRVDIPWEELRPGPVGNYLEVVDVDPASDCAYAPVDLNDPRILALQGLEPSEGNPQFHQQMVYAVAMKTIQNFERALGRVALWSPRRTRTRSGDGWSYREDFVPRLRIYPHALREANAFYSPERKALLFGYFPASRTDAGRNLPGGVVFTCLSHDIVAHETTHALLDGLHRRFAEPSNLDVYAFHEAFADIVALFQHFSFAEALHHQIAKTRGDLAQQNLLGQLAQQFGEAMGRRGALRDALGKVDKETGKWQSAVPNPDDYLTVEEPHARGAILVAAIFDAFLTIFKHRVRDLMRIATGGTGVLPEGAIHPDLTARLAREAAKTAQHVLTISIRALDYCPPVDITFGEYLRALITADSDLVPDDSHGYRIAFIEAFRRRGIYPERVRTLSVDSLRWHSPASLERLGGLDELLSKLDLSWDLGSERYKAYRQSQDNCKEFHRWAREHLFPHPEQRKEMGLAWGDDAPALIWKKRDGEVATEVHSVRPARRLNPDGSFITELVVELTQRRNVPRNPDEPARGNFQFRGGCTLLIDLQHQRVRYCIKKSVFDDERLERQRRFEIAPDAVSLHATYFARPHGGDAEPFALLHRGFES